MIILLDIDWLLYSFYLLDCYITALFKAISYLQGVDTLVQQLLGLLQQGSCQHHHTCGSITDLVVLRIGKVNQEFGSLVLDLIECY